MNKIAVCLLSGGIDSCVASSIAKKQGFELFTLSINYGQTLLKELDYSEKISLYLDAKEHKVIPIMPDDLDEEY